MKRGKLIVFEGINGCGKGTQIDLFSSYLRSKGKAVPLFLTGEPNNFDDNGKKAREILASNMDPLSRSREALHYFSENGRTHKNIYLPLMHQGIDVISDRLYHSRFAFQNAQGIPYEEILNANKFAIAPDITYILDVPVKEVILRLSKRDGKDRRKFDSNSEFLDKVRKNYLDLPNVLRNANFDKGIKVIDATGSPEEVSERIIDFYEQNN